MAIGKTLGTAAGYAASGAAAGAPFGPLGAGVGALAGGGIGLLRSLFGNKKNTATGNVQNAVSARQIPNQPGGNFLTGYTGYNQQLPTKSPEQISAINQLLPGTVNRLQGNEFDFNPIEQKSRQDFNKYTVPSLANRFAALGATNTDAYQNALANAQSEHELGLAGLRSEYGLRQQGQQQNLLGTLLAPQYENLYTPAQGGFVQGLAQNSTPALAQQGTEALSNFFSTNNNSDKAKQLLSLLGSDDVKKILSPEQINRLTSTANQLGGSGASDISNQEASGLGKKAALSAGTALTGALATELIQYLLQNRGAQ